MRAGLLISVRFHEGRYHGTGAWPPAPGRLFQALIAGAAGDSGLTAPHRAALGWLEALDAPVIAAPIVREGRGFTNYMPNNDLDAVGGDPARIAEIRAPKTTRPRFFDASLALSYAWAFDDNAAATGHAQAICEIADQLYQLGRGVDMAWARAEVLNAEELESRVVNRGTAIYRPALAGNGAQLACPHPGSLYSLEQRFAANRNRFMEQRIGRKIQQFFSQPPKPLFRMVAYNSPSTHLLFDIRKIGDAKATPDFVPQSVTTIVDLVERLRDSAAERLRRPLRNNPHHAAVVDRVFIGRDARDADKASRIRIIPLPSIGHPQATQAIRRVLVEIPPNCPLDPADIAWSLSGLDLIDSATGEVLATLLAADERTMLRHYGILSNETARVWRTVTPAALPEIAARRRIDPTRLTEPGECKNAMERSAEETRAIDAVRRALRHAQIEAPAATVCVQREPFAARGTRAEAFASGTRFAKERLWHVEITFTAPVEGPLIVGDGRYLGLGLMAPVRERARDVLIFPLPQDLQLTAGDRESLLHALRRALMSRAQNADGDVPRLFSGHENDGAPASSGRHDHIFLATDMAEDGYLNRLIVAAPWACDRLMRPSSSLRKLFDSVVSELRDVRAGALGVLALEPPMEPDEGDPLIGPARVWRSRTAFSPTRHAKRGENRSEALTKDVLMECERRGLPRAKVELARLAPGRGGDLGAHLQLRFSTAVKGPILLGRDSHRGGGLFAAVT